MDRYYYEIINIPLTPLGSPPHIKHEEYEENEGELKVGVEDVHKDHLNLLNC